MPKKTQKSKKRNDSSGVSRFNDAIASKTSWRPFFFGCTPKFRKLTEISSNRLEFKVSPKVKFSYIVTVLTGLLFLAIFILTVLEKGISNCGVEELTLMFMGIIPIGAGSSLLYFGTKPIVFDKQSGYYWKGKKGPDQVINKDSIKTLIKLDEIHAFQLVSKTHTGSENGSTNYQFNLILKNAERRNVASGYKSEEIRKDAKILSNFLGKPLWDAI